MKQDQSSNRPKRHPAALLMQIRSWHTYVGMLIAPTMIFMAVTGVLQIYSLHEAHAGYTPPAIVAKLGMVHKKQLFSQGREGPPRGERPAPARAAERPPADEAARAPRQATSLLKAFFAAASVGLVFSTLTGLWMALRQPLRRRTHLALLVIGTLAPVVLAALSA
jgi:hypothetical protein